MLCELKTVAMFQCLTLEHAQSKNISDVAIGKADFYDVNNGESKTYGYEVL